MGVLDDLTHRITVPYPDTRFVVLRHALVKQISDGFPAIRGGAHESGRCVSVHGPARSGKTTAAISAAQYLFARGRAGDAVRLVKATGCESLQELALATLRELQRSPLGSLIAAAAAALAGVPPAAGSAAAVPSHRLACVLAHSECLLILDDVDSMKGDAHERAAAEFAKMLICNEDCSGIRLLFTTRCPESRIWQFSGCVAVDIPLSMTLSEATMMTFATAFSHHDCQALFGPAFYCTVEAFVWHLGGYAELLTVSRDVVVKLADLVANNLWEDDASVQKRQKFIADAPGVRASLMGAAKQLVGCSTAVSVPALRLSLNDAAVTFATAFSQRDCRTFFGPAFYYNESTAVAFMRHLGGYSELLTVSPELVVALTQLVADNLRTDKPSVQKRQEFIADAPGARAGLMGAAKQQVVDALARYEAGRDVCHIRQRQLPPNAIHTHRCR